MDINHDTEKAMFLKMLEERFMELFGLEGWEYIIDNMVHEVYSPEDFGEDEESVQWRYELMLTEIEAQKALAEYLSKQMEEITGHTWTMVMGGRKFTIDDI
jgi:hypothetical protein